MEMKGTLQSTASMEEFLTKSFPYILQHDGSKPFILQGKLRQSASFARVYQFFPTPGGRMAGAILSAKRVNVRFAYDERFRLGEMRISAEGMALFPQAIQQMIEDRFNDVYVIPRDRMTETQAKRFGALNLDGKEAKNGQDNVGNASDISGTVGTHP